MPVVDGDDDRAWWRRRSLPQEVRHDGSERDDRVSMLFQVVELRAERGRSYGHLVVYNRTEAMIKKYRRCRWSGLGLSLTRGGRLLSDEKRQRDERERRYQNFFHG